MRLRYLCTTIILALLSFNAIAQAVIVFDSQRHDFGTIQEKMGVVTHNFEFRNTGSEPLVISKVRTSCGCTVPEYSEEPIAPGAVGHVKITFNPSGRPGKFSKSINVYTNTKPERTILRIIGEVVQEGAVPDMQYAYRIGDIALKTLHLSMSKIIKGRVRVDSVEVVNVGSEPLVPRAINVPQHMIVAFIPDTLQKGEEGVMLVTYNPDVIDDWGYRRDEFNIVDVVSNNATENEAQYNTITVSGVLQEDFDSYTAEQRENAPILVVGRSVVDFKVVEGTQKVRREIYVVNAGYSPLEIHKVRTDAGVLNAYVKKKKIKPGQSTTMVIELDPMRARSNTLLSDIFIVSNDPSNSSQTIRVTAELR